MKAFYHKSEKMSRGEGAINKKTGSVQRTGFCDIRGRANAA